MPHDNPVFKGKKQKPTHMISYIVQYKMTGYMQNISHHKAIITDQNLLDYNFKDIEFVQCLYQIKILMPNKL